VATRRGQLECRAQRAFAARSLEPVTKPRPARVLGDRPDYFVGEKRFNLSNDSPTGARD
jgi:hypothetical protein